MARAAGAAGWAVAALILSALTAVAPAQATEDGNQEYPLGVNTVLPGLLPPPGHAAYLNYFLYYSAPIVTDSNGTKAQVNFHFNLELEAGRFLYSWPVDLGNFGITSGVAQSIGNDDTRVGALSDDRAGLGDTLLQPLILGYNSPDHTLFAWVDSDIWVPTGQYNTHSLYNLGLNRVEVSPSFAVTWFPSQRIQASLFGTFEMPFKNPATQYLSGKSVDFDYALDYQPVPSWKRFHIGVGGYAFQQVTPDRVNGALYNDGNYGRVVAIGPQIRYDWKMGGIAVKWQHEFAAENRTQGDQFWVQFAIPVF